MESSDRNGVFAAQEKNKLIILFQLFVVFFYFFESRGRGELLQISQIKVRNFHKVIDFHFEFSVKKFYLGVEAFDNRPGAVYRAFVAGGGFFVAGGHYYYVSFIYIFFINYFFNHIYKSSIVYFLCKLLLLFFLMIYFQYKD